MKSLIKIILSLFLCHAVMLILQVSVIYGQGNSNADTEWYLNSYRKLFFDFHTQRSAVDVAKGFDAERWAEQLEKAHVQAVSLHSLGNHGWSYYRKGKFRHVHPQMPSGMDIVEEVTKACHKRGIKVIGYFNLLHSEPIFDQHPDWIARDKDGEMIDNTLSFFSPYLDEMLFPQLEEYARNYDVDGIFFDFLYARTSYDEYAKKAYREATGKEIPISSDDPDYDIYVKWMLEQSKDMRDRAFKAVHRGRADILTSVNWAYTYRQPEIPPDNTGFLSLDIFPQDQVFNGSYVAKNWVTLGKPFDIMNSAFLRWWGDWGMKPTETLMQECATAIANGGRTWIGYQYTAHYSVEPAIMEEYRKVFEFVMEREDYCNGAEPVPYIAVLHSSHGHYTHDPTLRVDETGLQAAYKMLMESGFHFNILDEETLLKNLDHYKLVILPDQRYIDDRLAEGLERFVRNGGGLIATALTGTQNSSYTYTGKSNLGDILGVQLEGKYPHSHAYINVTDNRIKKDILEMPQQAWGECVFVKPTSAESLAELWDVYLRSDGKFLLSSSPPGKNTGYPAVTLNSFGKGKAAFISSDIFNAYSFRNQWHLKNMLRNLINIVVPEKLIEITAPGLVEVVLTKKDNSVIVHLVNHYREKQLGNSITIAEHVIPVSDIGVKVKLSQSPESVTLIPENKKLEWNFSNGFVTFTVPKLHIHSLVAIEK